MEISIRPIVGTIQSEVFIFNIPRRGLGASGEYFTFSQDGILAHKVTLDGSIDLFKPAFVADDFFIKELIEAFSKVASQRGIEPMSESKAKGKLEAMELHLADMRKLVFEEKVVIDGRPA